MAKYRGPRGGAPGGGGANMNQLMRQAQKMQQDLAKAQQELAETEVVATAGGEMVEIVMTCDRQLSSIKIKPEAVDPDDVEMLEDLIQAAFNEASKLVEAEHERIMGPFSGAMSGLGGLF
ncbi:MAG: YbaB/EbfC family nucleoid-associated protein [Christensenellales bacterium]|nr:YbaB/EbfC family nucleoid-associated protein [Clostridiales bacterium]